MVLFTKLLTNALSFDTRVLILSMVLFTKLLTLISDTIDFLGF